MHSPPSRQITTNLKFVNETPATLKMTSKVSSGLGSSDEMNISTEETFGKRFLKDFEEKEVLGIGHFG